MSAEPNADLPFLGPEALREVGVALFGGTPLRVWKASQKDTDHFGRSVGVFCLRTGRQNPFRMSVGSKEMGVF